MSESMMNFIKKRPITLIFSVIFLISLFASISVWADNLPFKIKSADITEKSLNVIGDIKNIKSDELSSDITFHKLNDYVIYNLKIQNTSGKKITILSITDDNDNSYIDYQYDKHENEEVFY